VRVYINKDIEFNVDIYDDNDTCGWLLDEVKSRYLLEMEKLRELKDQRKVKKRIIVALRTSDQRESIDFWLT
jgi:hypothetical protein